MNSVLLNIKDVLLKQKFGGLRLFYSIKHSSNLDTSFSILIYEGIEAQQKQVNLAKTTQIVSGRIRIQGITECI